MAFISKNNQFLIETGTGPNLAEFATRPGASQLTLSFHEVTNGAFNLTPTATICSGKSYVLRVNSTNTNGLLGGFTAATTTFPNGTYTVIPLAIAPAPQSTSVTGLTLFTPTVISGVILLSTPFSATLSNPAAGGVQQFILTASPNFAMVGYSAALPSLLSNCTICGCATGRTCRNGLCETAPNCTSQSQCGDLGGSCPGICPVAGTVCTSINGVFRCVQPASSAVTIVMWVLIALIVLFVLILLIYVIYRIATRTPGGQLTQTQLQAIYRGEAQRF